MLFPGPHAIAEGRQSELTRPPASETAQGSASLERFSRYSADESMQASLDLSRLRRGGLRRWPGLIFRFRVCPAAAADQLNALDTLSFPLTSGYPPYEDDSSHAKECPTRRGNSPIKHADRRRPARPHITVRANCDGISVPCYLFTTGHSIRARRGN
jgi:hypothetical protein